MVEVASVFQGCQIGVEPTLGGAAVPADKRLLALGLEPAFNPEFRKFRGMGHKYTAIESLDREWTAVTINTQPTYTDLIYALSGILTKATTSLGSGAYQHLFTTDPSGPDDIKSFTIEYGNDATGARRFANAVVPSLGLSFSRQNGVTGRGDMIGTAIEEGITMTTSPETIPLIPVLPGQTCVYLDEDPGDLGTSKLHRVSMAEWNIGNKFGPVWALDCDEGSYVGTVETPPDHTLKLAMAHDAEGIAMVDRFRNATNAFIRIEATGPLIGGSIRNRLRIDFAGAIGAVEKPSDVDGILSINWTFEALEEAAWGNVLQIEVINALSDL